MIDRIEAAFNRGLVVDLLGNKVSLDYYRGYYIINGEHFTGLDLLTLTYHDKKNNRFIFDY